MTEEEKPLELREAQIREATQKLMQESGEGPKKFLNNFALEFSATRRAMRDDMDEKPIDKTPVEGKSVHSALRNSQTAREFFATLDQIAAEVVPGFDIEHELAAQLARQKVDVFSDASSDSSFWDKLMPVYIRLRAMGYNHHDLTGK